MTTGTTEDEAVERKLPLPRVYGRCRNDRPGAPGRSRELLAQALPLVVSQSFMTVQVFVDTVVLAHHEPLEMAASFPAVIWFWLPFGLLQVTAGYVSTSSCNMWYGSEKPRREPRP